MYAEKQGKGGKKEFSKEYNKDSNTYALEAFLEIDFVAAIEDSLECSGFCKPALFYWEQDIYSGVPSQSCGYEVLDFFRKSAGPLKAELRVVAVTCLWLFFLHFTLYGKPKPED